MGTIFDTLKDIGVASEQTKTLFATATRDNEDLPVWRDSRSGVIYIDDFYIGHEEYESGQYRDQQPSDPFEDLADSTRRLADYEPFYRHKNICDLGCGEGSFLIGAQQLAHAASGVELQGSFRAALNERNIPCQRSILDHPGPFDTVFMFHLLEHFEHPLRVLADVRQRMNRDGSKLIIEVPHANDFLIATLKNQAFIDFTLWSQHLILHTRQSLAALLAAAGFANMVISGRQRYGLANHLTWLGENRPGGHRSPLASFETGQLRAAYEQALQKFDGTDTLIAIADY
ncbi:MAG TPA: methyltransferase domain-containing protein [Rhodospirillales bacterium]|mgnify:CR=1 FL=1|nr:methyltransferase domain-containing protein [Rhodospirillales bacterium]